MVAVTPANDELWKSFFANRQRVDLRNRLAEIYLPLVRYQAECIASRLPAWSSIDIDDLYSAGAVGLMSAIAGFDAGRGFKFETYCVPRVRGAMLDELRGFDWIPRLVRKRQAEVAKARARIKAETGLPASIEELAIRCGLSEREVISLEAPAVGSLDKKCYETDAREIDSADFLSDPKAEDPTRRQAELDALRELTVGLNRSERIIIVMYYFEGSSMKEIGASLDLSESRVSQMHAAIIARLRSRMGIDVRRLGGGTIGMKSYRSSLQPTTVTHAESNDRDLPRPARRTTRTQSQSRGVAKAGRRSRQGTDRSH